MQMPMFNLCRTVILVGLARMDEACAGMALLRERWPNATLRRIVCPPFERTEDRRTYLEALREAGLPE
jgi:hypothetical protein